METKHLYQCVDFHSHLLPALDDGSESVEQSLAMLDESRRQGVSLMVATPHFYPENESPTAFLARREAAVSRLLGGGYDPTVHPRLALGAEVAYFRGLARCEDLEHLCIVGTRSVLIEMPFSRWTGGVIDEIVSIPRSRGIMPVLAHVDRYPDAKDAALRQYLIEQGVLLQVNAEAFEPVLLRRRILRWLGEQTVHLIGSDCHDTVRRPQKMAHAYEVIGQSRDAGAIEDRLRAAACYALDGVRLLGMANE